MVTRDLRLVGSDERSAAHDVVATDDEAIDPVWRREDEARNEILGSSELKAVGSPDGEVRTLAGLEGADVVATQHGCTASRPEAEGLAHGHRPGPATTARDEERLLHLGEQVAALVRRRSVDAEPDPDPGVEILTNRRDARSHSEVRRRAVGDPRV
jgi:hypothetical protein